MKQQIYSFLKTYANGAYKDATILPGIEALTIVIPSDANALSERQIKLLSRRLNRLIEKPVKVWQIQNRAVETLHRAVFDILRSRLHLHPTNVLLSTPTQHKCNASLYFNNSEFQQAWTQKKDITKLLISLLKLYNLTLANLSVDTDLDESVSDLQILQIVNTYAPITPVDIATHLKQSLKREVSVAVIEARLKSLQNRKLLIWMHGDAYALSLSGLTACSILLSNAKGDVSRLLALGRHKW